MSKNKNANYDFEDQGGPKHRMGQGDFANLPSKPMYGSFGKPTYRGGNINSFTAEISDLSEIEENGSYCRREKNDYE